MSFVNKLPERATVVDGFSAWPDLYQPFNEYCELVLRQTPSKLSPAERELIGAYVSGLNGCDYCLGIHRAAVRAYGLDDTVIDVLLDDLDAADVSNAMRPVLRFARKLTLHPDRVGAADIDAMRAQGWDDDDIHMTVAVTCIFSFMNRFVHGLGIEDNPKRAERGGRWLKEHGYAGLSELLRRAAKSTAKT